MERRGRHKPGCGWVGEGGLPGGDDVPVSYTHLDVYKRQVLPLALLLTASIHQDERRFAPGSDPDEELASFKIQDGFEICLLYTSSHKEPDIIAS